MTIAWLPYEIVVSIHGEQLLEHGGRAGLRDEGLLRSALARPQNLLAYQPEASLARLAAAYAYGITQNHSFIDGNKRVALLTVFGFLAINGHRLDATERDAERVMLGVAAGEIEEAELTDWIDHNMVATAD